MLHALSHRKSTLYRRYQGHREDSDERRVAEEDEVTSLIMGPLAFLSPAAIGAFWSSLVSLRGTQNDFPPGPPSHALMQFWPRKGKIEPDMRVDLSWGDDLRVLLVEFKWRAPLSGKDQLHLQWEQYLSPQERAIALHLFIGLDTSEAVNAINRRNTWQGKLLMRSWFDVLTATSAVRGERELELRRWKEQIELFFDLLGVRPFRGFDGLCSPTAACPSRPLFFS